MTDGAGMRPALRRHGGWLAALSGAATVAAFAPWGWAPLAVLSPALLFGLWDGATPRAAFRLGFCWAVGLFLAGSWWLYVAIHDFGQAPAWLAVLLLAGLVAIMASYYGLLGWLTLRFGPGSGAWRWLLLWPAGWTLMEALRGWLFTGFPWLEVGYAHSDNWLAAFAPLGGVHLTTLASALTAGAVVAWVQGGRRERCLAAAVAVLLWGGAALLARTEWTRPAGEDLSVALLQGAVPQDEKWQQENRAATLELYRRLNREALGARLIVWPEAVLPLLAHEARDYLAAVHAESQARGSDLLIGLLRYEFDSERVYNGLLALSAEGSAWYDKRRLVPFGEFFPVPAFIRRWMRLMSLPYYDMSAGAADQPPLAVAGQLVGATICYEDAYGNLQRPVLDRATLLVNVTNNAWFGDSAAPHQQLQMARFRAREAGRYLMRATSNGITAVLGPDGRVLAAAPQFQPAVLRARVRPLAGLTPYARGGDWPVLGLSLAMCAVTLASGMLRRPRQKPE
ncbi:MAG: apolipoprotein N-acyltransferase [Gammaproteobacteria bacterium]|nr:MAG: apolipoprotein N-acyltransferase [Gammaproteobacteria bacterium]